MRGITRAGLILVAILAAAAAGLAAWSPLPLAEWLRDPRAAFFYAEGWNPYPVRLLRPMPAPLSAMAQLGKKIFFDPGLSSSRRLSCASCHVPRDAYGPAGALPAMFGGQALTLQGVRAVPSLRYLERQPNFGIGPDNAEDETANRSTMPPRGAGAPRAGKTAQNSVNAAAGLVPQGGLFWDGRADTLQNQALIPLSSPFEMDGGSVAEIAARLARASYAPAFARLFGPSVFSDAQMAVAEAMFAVARYQIEDIDFHPYTSKFDFWLEGKARMSPAELRGFLVFNDPHKGNCAACHLDRPGADGLPPLFTDHQFEALGVPRNPALAVNRDPSYFDLGLCGPFRTDMKTMTQYCGFFATPSLRNVARRRTFFHNGIYNSLQQVLDFYDFRDTYPEKVYPDTRKMKPDMYNDLPQRYRSNVDKLDAPFTGTPSGQPPLAAQEVQDVIAFLGTLTDGYRPPGGT